MFDVQVEAPVEQTDESADLDATGVHAHVADGVQSADVLGWVHERFDQAPTCQAIVTKRIGQTVRNAMAAAMTAR